MQKIIAKLFMLCLLVFINGCNSLILKKSGVHLASDATTGEYLGVVMLECRDFESKEIVSYIIGKDNRKIEKSPDEIKIYEP